MDFKKAEGSLANRGSIEDENGRVTMYFEKSPSLRYYESSNDEEEEEFGSEVAPSGSTPTGTRMVLIGRERMNSKANQTPVRSESLSRPKSIGEESRDKLWNSEFGEEAHMVEWSIFEQGLNKHLPYPMTPAEEKVMQHLLDNSSTGYVTRYKFSEFLKGFGPVRECVEKVKKILAEKWFQGFLTAREAKLLIQNEEPGTFLIRFSKSRPGSFALAYKSKTGVHHILILSNFPNGLKIYEEDAKTYRSFADLKEILKFYGHTLVKPYSSILPKESWFQGDISSEEADELLYGMEPGTFMIRFSSSGELAASFVDTNYKVLHSLITKEGGRYLMRSDSNEVLFFSSIRELVKYYSSLHIFIRPIKNASSIFIEERIGRKPIDADADIDGYSGM